MCIFCTGVWVQDKVYNTVLCFISVSNFEKVFARHIACCEAD